MKKVLEEERWQQRREGDSECGDGHGCEEGSQGERGAGGSAIAWALVDLKAHLGQGSLSSESPALQTLKSLPRHDRALGPGGGRLERGEQLRMCWGPTKKGAGGWKEGRVGEAEVTGRGGATGVIQPLGRIFLELLFKCGLWVGIVWKRGSFPPRGAGVR